MCGIFGYVGKQTNVSSMILEGLKVLEYRGYDSWGIAIKNKHKITVKKDIGKIGKARVDVVYTTLGIGHTRWATHGGVTVANAHPHLDCTGQIAVVHNGIVENFQELKDQLLQKGHKFISETDTEVIAHLVEENLKKEEFREAVRNAFLQLKGLSAIVVAYAPSEEIIACKTGSPLVAGISEKGFFIASDALGIIKHTKQMVFLKDKEMVVLGKEIKLFSLTSGEKLKIKFEKINWKLEDVGKGNYAHFMLKEIYEQPKIISNIAQNYGQEIKYLAKLINQAKGTFFIGAGTSYHACLGGVYLFSKIIHKHVNTAVASEFNYLEDFLTKESLIIALSQSGETIDIIEPLKSAKAKGVKIVALTNVLGSSIYRMSDRAVLLNAGPEKAVASTKVYIAKLAVLIALAFSLAQKSKYAAELLMKTAAEVKRLLEPKNIEQLEGIAAKISKSKNIYVIGRGLSYSTALEAGLKIKEVSYIPTEGLAGGELKHGTIALIEKDIPCIVFAPEDETYGAIISNAMEIKSRGAMIIGISPKNSGIFDYWIKVNDLQEASIIAQIVPVQLLAYFLAVKRNLDPDKPRNLAKSVTVR